jgi:hypothetical protein
MKTLNLYGPFRYLNPRASGLIVFKGGSGASPEQVDASVQSGVTAVNANTDAGFAAAGTELNTVKDNQNTMIQNQADLTQGQSDIKGNQGQLKQGQNEIITNQGNLTLGQESLMAGQGKILDDIGAIDFSGVETGLTDLTADAKEGFADIGTRFNTVDKSLTDLGSDLTTGMGKVTGGQSKINTNISDLSGKVTTGFNDVDSALEKGFTGVTGTVNNRFDTQDKTLTDMSANILKGQGSLQSYLEGLSGRADTYYEGLNQGQSDIKGSLGGLQDNFTEYQKQYTDDTALANKARADLATQVTGGFGQMKDDLSRNFQATTEQNTDIVRNTQEALQNQEDMSADFGTMFRQLGSGMEAQTTQQQTSKNDMLQRLETIREVILTQGENLDPALTMQFAKFADSFDAEGRLIEQSTDNNGNVTRRGFDTQNNLSTATFDASGAVVDRSFLNVNQLMNTMDELGYQSVGGDGLMSNSAPFSASFS